MQLTAYYISSDEFGTKNQTINFGGKNFYELRETSKGKIKINRTENERYISKFYGEDKKLVSLSAVVGKNGSGKTNLLINLIDCISGYKNSTNILLFESNEKILLFFGNTDAVHGMGNNKRWEVEPVPELTIEILNKNIRSIYYSPHLDHRDGISGIDVSFDKLIYQDLEETENIVHHTNQLNPIKQHEFNNFRRQKAFIDSVISTKLYEEFNLPKPEKIKLSFSRIKDAFTNGNQNEFKFHNTPRQFQELFNETLKKIESERNLHRTKPLVSLQKEALKEYTLIDILCFIIDVAERKNTYLEEGKLEDDYNKEITDLSAIETFYYFLRTHYYILGTSRKTTRDIKLQPNPIPRQEIKELLDKLYTVIDNLPAKDERDDEYFDWNNKCIFPSINDATKLLELSMKFTEQLKRYYQVNPGDIDSLTDVASFINYEWYDRTPSSGENAVLNLFSRLLTIKREMQDSEIGYYLLFLDEGDAGFHPEWKKKFIEIITKITPILFDKNGIEFQIIFTTHDPLTLSDILNYNIVYLNSKEGENHIFLNFDDINRPSKSFAANITDLLNDSFFIGDGLIGDFSKRKIKEAIKWLNSKTEKIDENNYYNRLIKNIDEPIVQRKLSEMYDEKMNTNLQKKIIDQQIKNLQELKSKLK